MASTKTDGTIRILLIEDDEDDHLLIRELLAENGDKKFELDWARDFQSGLEAINSCDHDVYLVDYRLGAKDGVSLISEAIASGCKSPLILLTGAGDREVAMKALSAGAADYLVKGDFNGEALERAIRYAIEQSRAAEMLEEKVRQRTAELESVNAALITSEGRYRALFNQVVGGIAEAGLDGKFILVNDRFCEMVGYSRQELLGGMTITSITHPDDLPRTLLCFERMFETTKPFDIEKRYITKDGRTIWVHNSVAAVLNPEGKVQSAAAVSVDITSRKHEEDRLAILARLGEITRTTENPETLLRAVAEMVGRNFDARRALFNEIDLDADTETIHSDYRRTGVKSIAGKHRISEYSPLTTADMMAGKTVINNDSKTDERTASIFKKTYEPAAERAYIAVPLLRGGRWVASFWISDDQPRQWAQDEIRLIENVAERAFLAVERLRDQESLEKSRDELEVRVTERTAQLMTTLDQLKAENEQRLRAETERTSLLDQLVGIQEAERRRIARDLHDELGQQLTALRLNVRNAREMAHGDGLADLLDSTQKIAENLDADIGFLAWELRPATLELLGLSATLAAYLREWSRFSGVKADFLVNNFGDTRLEKRVEINMYRIVQEALNNVSKYAKATVVSVLLERTEKTISMIIEDDGVGFDAKINHIEGLGLIGMRERAAIIGGSLIIESSPQGGTTIFVRVPISPLIQA